MLTFRAKLGTHAHIVEKKAVSLSIASVVVVNASYTYTTYMYPKSDVLKYLTAIVCNAVLAVITIACA